MRFAAVLFLVVGLAVTPAAAQFTRDTDFTGVWKLEIPGAEEQ